MLNPVIYFAFLGLSRWVVQADLNLFGVIFPSLEETAMKRFRLTQRMNEYLSKREKAAYGDERARCEMIHTVIALNVGLLDFYICAKQRRG